MLPALINMTAMLLIIGFFLRWIEVRYPETAIGKSLAFLY